MSGARKRYVVDEDRYFMHRADSGRRKGGRGDLPGKSCLIP
jgi:hypothetical protein